MPSLLRHQLTVIRSANLTLNTFDLTLVKYSIDLDTYQSNLHQLTEIDKNKQPFRWTSVANRIEEFEEKFCV